MFWRKKNPVTDEITTPSDDKREAFRYQFKPDQGFEIDFKGNKIRVIDISAGGLAFQNINFSLFDSDKISFSLDIPTVQGTSNFFAGVRILKIDSENVCHCIFEDFPLDQHELIHKYVLEMQKQDLRSNIKNDPSH